MGRGIRSVVSALVVAAGLSPVVVGAGAASAYVPCTYVISDTREVYGPGGATSVRFDLSRSGVPYDARVADVDVYVHADTRPGTRFSLSTRYDRIEFARIDHSEIGPPLRVTWDDEAPTWRSPGQYEGRFRPDLESLSRFDGQPVDGHDPEGWVLTLATFSSQTPRLYDAGLVITIDSCDSDGDGVPERIDNCPSVANQDQADADRDGIGDVCDPTPRPPAPPAAPPPAPGPSPAPPVPPGTAPGTGPGASLPGCSGDACRYDRTVGMRLADGRFRGRVASPARGCRVGTAVTVWRVRAGEDQRVIVVRTRATATFRARAPRRAGRYYATVGSAAETMCASDRSPAVRVRRR